MEILVFLCIISHLNLVLTDDNVAIDPAVTQTNTYKVHPDPKDLEPENDQVAESSQPVGQIYGHGVVATSQKEGHDEAQNRIQVAVGQLDEQNVHQVSEQHEAHLHEGFRQEDLQSVLNQGYTQPQQIYVHQYPIQPIRILDAEAAPLQQVHTNENQKTLGYSSYVEHVTHKDEDEINSALQEGSISDIKRLVPKSEMSFKIYKNGQTVNLEPQKHEIQANLVPQTEKKNTGGYQSTLHHRMKTGASQHQTSGLKQTWQQHAFGNSQQLQSAGKTYVDQPSVNGHTVYYNQAEVNSQKSFPEIIGKSSVVKPNFKIQVGGNDYNQPTSTVRFNSVSVSKGSNQHLADITNLQYHKQWNLDSKAEGSQKTVNNAKALSSVHYDIDPVAQAERVRGVHYSQTHPISAAVNHVAQNNYQKQQINLYGDKNTKPGANFPTSYATNGVQNNFAGHLPNKAHFEQNPTHLVNYLKSGNHGNSESVKLAQNHVVNHLGTTGYEGSQAIKSNQNFGLQSFTDSQSAKSEHGVVSQAHNSFGEIKTGQNNFDHQKALEGSTSFDIKNAIDTTGNLMHHTNYGSPTTEGHQFIDIQKQQLAYVIPKIPNLIDNSVHHSSGLEAHQIKDFGISSPQLSYHAVPSPDVSGKFFHQPQTILWASDHLKQGNGLTANDLQHSIIKVHLPKEEIYQHVKTPNIHLPTSSLSHIAYQKQPYMIHYDVPVLKYPQEIHFPQKTKFRIQNNQAGHLKLAQPVTIDWSLFKSMPNVQSLAAKPELMAHIQEGGKKIVPILVRKRKNRSNNKQEIGVVYGKVNNNRRPTIPTHRQEKSIRVNLLPEASNNMNNYETKGERKNEFSVSASYKVDRSFKTSNSS